MNTLKAVCGFYCFHSFSLGPLAPSSLLPLLLSAPTSPLQTPGGRGLVRSWRSPCCHLRPWRREGDRPVERASSPDLTGTDPVSSASYRERERERERENHHVHNAIYRKNDWRSRILCRMIAPLPSSFALPMVLCVDVITSFTIQLHYLTVLTLCLSSPTTMACPEHCKRQVMELQ